MISQPSAASLSADPNITPNGCSGCRSPQAATPRLRQDHTRPRRRRTRAAFALPLPLSAPSPSSRRALLSSFGPLSAPRSPLFRHAERDNTPTTSAPPLSTKPRHSPFRPVRNKNNAHMYAPRRAHFSKCLTSPLECAMICKQKTFGTDPRGRRGSPAKGVVRVNRSQGSNPCFSASKIPLYKSGIFHSMSRRDSYPRLTRVARGQYHSSHIFC